MDGGYYFLGDYEDSEEEEFELPVVEKLEALREAIGREVDAMDKLTSGNKEFIEEHLLQNNGCVSAIVAGTLCD
jgi:hypothetical protein